jgi:hypothetical protein
MQSASLSTSNSSPGVSRICFRTGLGRTTRRALSREVLNFIWQVYRNLRLARDAVWEKAHSQKSLCHTALTEAVVVFRGVGGFGSCGLRC